MLNKIMTELYVTNQVRDIITNMAVNENDADDLEQEIYQILLEYDEEKIIDMYRKKQLKFFIVGVVQRQYHSTTSPYFKKYKKYYSLVDANHINNQENYDEYEEF